MTVERRSPAWTYWRHLPGLRMPPGEEHAFGPCSLAGLTHDEWRRLDQTMDEPVWYADCRPVFLRGQVTGPMAQGDGVRALFPDASVYEGIDRQVRLAHRALSLAFLAPALPPPELSCGYLLREGESRCETFLIGTCGREWIIGGHHRSPRHELDVEHLQRARVLFEHLLHLPSPPDPALEAALRSQELLGLPDVRESLDGVGSRDLGVMLAVAALERLVVPPPRSRAAGDSITAAFARHAAVLLVDDFELLDARSEELGRLYRLRSDLIHGRRALDLDDASHTHQVALAQVALALALQRLIVLPPDAGGAPLHARLAQAASDRGAYEALAGAWLDLPG